MKKLKLSLTMSPSESVQIECCKTKKAVLVLKV